MKNSKLFRRTGVNLMNYKNKLYMKYLAIGINKYSVPIVR